MSANSNTAPTITAAPLPEPVFGRAAVAVLGSMILLIVALTGVLVQTTLADSMAATEVPAIEASDVDSESVAQR
ncbi:MAG: hypothetical protein H0T90_05050 [Gemmatimonadales bacterium]|nr:hypothetical protein [Gemmatimonadales bacterium]